MNDLISVVVPVYNVKKYLERCVKSILSQTYSELEVILIDDGSTDGSGACCDAMGKTDSRITVIHQENGGLSAARNTGLDIAKGEYIAFVDSDDYIDIDMFRSMISEAQACNADISICGINYVDEAGKSLSELSQSERIEIDDKAKMLRQLRERDVLTVVQWNKLYRRIIFEGLRYPNGKCHEDVYVIHKELYKANKIVYIPHSYYNYVQREGSIMNLDEDIRQIRDAVEGYNARIAFFQDNGEKIACKDSVQDLYAYLTWKYYCLYGHNNKNTYDEVFEMLKRASNMYCKIVAVDDKQRMLLNNRWFCDLKLWIKNKKALIK